MRSCLIGPIPSKLPYMAPMFESMASHLFDSCKADWSPMKQTSEPVNWHRRDLNLIADFLVNFTMGCKQERQHEFKPTVLNCELNDAQRDLPL